MANYLRQTDCEGDGPHRGRATRYVSPQYVQHPRTGAGGRTLLCEACYEALGEDTELVSLRFYLSRHG